MKRSIVSCLLLIMPLAVASLKGLSTAAAQSKPDFSGVWKLKLEDSRLMPDNGVSKLLDIEIKIDHKGSNFHEMMTVTRSDGDQTAEGKYIIDGKDYSAR